MKIDKSKHDSEPDKKPKKIKKWAKELISILLIVSLFSFALDYYYSANMPSGSAPHIVGTGLNGEILDVNELSKNQPVVVYFWATWCGACSLVSPTIERYSHDNPVVSVALSSGDDAQIRQYMQENEYQFSVLNDVTGTQSQNWGVRVTPTVVIIRDGEIKNITTGVLSPMGLWFRVFMS